MQMSFEVDKDQTFVVCSVNRQLSRTYSPVEEREDVSTSFQSIIPPFLVSLPADGLFVSSFVWLFVYGGCESPLMKVPSPTSKIIQSNAVAGPFHYELANDGFDLTSRSNWISVIGRIESINCVRLIALDEVG